MVVSKITLVQCKIHKNQFEPNGRGTIPSSVQVSNVLFIKQEITSKKFGSLQTVKNTAEGFSKPIMQEYVVIFCILKPDPNSVKISFSRKNLDVEQGPVIPSFLCCLDEFCLFEFFRSFNGDLVYFFLASTCMFGLLSYR